MKRRDDADTGGEWWLDKSGVGLTLTMGGMVPDGEVPPEMEYAVIFPSGADPNRPFCAAIPGPDFRCASCASIGEAILWVEEQIARRDKEELRWGAV